MLGGLPQGPGGPQNSFTTLGGIERDSSWTLKNPWGGSECGGDSHFACEETEAQDGGKIHKWTSNSGLFLIALQAMYPTPLLLSGIKPGTQSVGNIE